MNLATGKARHGLEGVGVFAWSVLSEEALHLRSGDRTAKKKRHCTVDVTRFRSLSRYGETLIDCDKRVLRYDLFFAIGCSDHSPRSLGTIPTLRWRVEGPTGLEDVA